MLFDSHIFNSQVIPQFYEGDFPMTVQFGQLIGKPIFFDSSPQQSLGRTKHVQAMSFVPADQRVSTACAVFSMLATVGNDPVPFSAWLNSNGHMKGYISMRPDENEVFYSPADRGSDYVSLSEIDKNGWLTKEDKVLIRDFVELYEQSKTATFEAVG
jgi:hypothetical protein